MPVWVHFVVGYVVLSNLVYSGLQIWLLPPRTLRPLWLAVAVGFWGVAMGGLFALEIYGPCEWEPVVRGYLYFPMSIEMVWNVLLLPLALPAMLLATIIVRLRRCWRSSAAAPVEDRGMSRRRFLYLAGCGAAPAVAAGMGVHGLLSEDDLRVRKFDIPIAHLPPGLEGFTIAHVSDLHSGIFVGPKRLKIMSDLANDVKADLVVVTGDLVNRFTGEFPDALAALQRIESRHGMFLCEGNHDVLAGPGLIRDACRRNRLLMLWSEMVGLPFEGGRLLIGGLPWLSPGPDTPSTLVTSLYPPREEGDVRLLLAHHPHFFDVSDQVDLLLSGHTHGGQIMFGDVGLGNLRFKYNSGRFHRGNMTMIVNNGCGDWFPCRIGAPAEIGLLRLTKAI